MATATEQIMVFDCDHCGRTVTKRPVRDEMEVHFVGLDKARAWCSEDCHEAAAERQHVGWS